MKSLDILGKRINFYYKNEETINSGFGGLISSFIVIILALLISSFGQDFFKRINPSMVSSVKSPLDYTKFWINNKNFSFAFQIGIDSFYSKKNTTLFYPVVEHFYYTKDENNSWVGTKEVLEVEPCSDDLFYDGNDFIANSAPGVMNCPIFTNNLVGGYADGQFMAKIQIEIFQCLEGETDLDGNPCESDELKDSILAEKLYFVLYYQSALIDANNYNQGIKRTIESSYYTLDKYLYKNSYYFFQNITLETDFGWIMKSKKSESFLAFKTKYMDMNSVSTFNSGEYAGSLSRAVIYFSKDTLEYSREYEKIQTLTAQVGGVIKMFMMIGAIIVDRYNLFKAKFELGSLVMYDNQEEIKNYHNICELKNNNKFIKEGNLSSKNKENENNLFYNLKDIKNKDILDNYDSINNSNNKFISNSKFIKSGFTNNKDQLNQNNAYNNVNTNNNCSNTNIKEVRIENNIDSNYKSNKRIDKLDVVKLNINNDHSYSNSNQNIINIQEKQENNNENKDRIEVSLITIYYLYFSLFYFYHIIIAVFFC